jgi:hypothetical protein
MDRLDVSARTDGGSQREPMHGGNCRTHRGTKISLVNRHNVIGIPRHHPIKRSIVTATRHGDHLHSAFGNPRKYVAVESWRVSTDDRDAGNTRSTCCQQISGVDAATHDIDATCRMR